MRSGLGRFGWTVLTKQPTMGDDSGVITSDHLINGPQKVPVKATCKLEGSTLSLTEFTSTSASCVPSRAGWCRVSGLHPTLAHPAPYLSHLQAQKNKSASTVDGIPMWSFDI